MTPRLVLMIVLALFVVLSPRTASACRLALVIAVDVSKSVDSTDFKLQFQGLAAAFRDGEVQAALLSTREPVAVAALEWSGPQHQSLITDWYFIRDVAGAEFLASRFASHQRGAQGQKTAIGEAASFSRLLLARVPQCKRQVIDISGDGYNNAGRKPKEVYANGGFSGITVNGLVVGGITRLQLRKYFETEVIHGPGAFVIATHGFEDYAEAIRRKLLREITSRNDVAMADDPR